MLTNYLKIAFRNLAHNKVYSLINILGLAIGITTCTLITLYVIDEAGYDKHFADCDRIYRVAIEDKDEKWVALSAPVAGGLKKDYPEVEQVARLLRMPGVEKFF
ncbi:ABC transporter permease [Dyadobacter luticola]|uniref:ABC transporter permease n=1 Tax=Dyadobacter luticola TaxID=1979387 RepID=UPI001E504D84|nr:ABC transporter permease [Dyadobacter luticola]